MNNLKKFDDTLDDFNKEVSRLQSVSEAYRKLAALVADYAEIQEKLEKNSQILEKSNGLLKTQQENFSRLIEEKIEQIRKENKEFYKEFESSIKIKLDDNVSQIKQLIEHERSQIKQIFEVEFAKNTNDLKQTFEKEITQQTQSILKGQKSNKRLLWIFGSLILIVSISIFLKLLGIFPDNLDVIPFWLA